MQYPKNDPYPANPNMKEGKGMKFRVNAIPQVLLDGFSLFLLVSRHCTTPSSMFAVSPPKQTERKEKAGIDVSAWRHECREASGKDFVGEGEGSDCDTPTVHPSYLAYSPSPLCPPLPSLTPCWSNSLVVSLWHPLPQPCSHTLVTKSSLFINITCPYHLGIPHFIHAKPHTFFIPPWHTTHGNHMYG